MKCPSSVTAAPCHLPPRGGEGLLATNATLHFQPIKKRAAHCEPPHFLMTRSFVFSRSEKIGYKIREAQLEKIPYMLVIGNKEVENNCVAVRSRKKGDLGQMPTDDFIKMALEEINSKAK